MHIPVLVEEVMDLLRPVDQGIYVDGNLGMGGHTAMILEKSGPSGRVIGFDLDEKAIAIARTNLAAFGERVEFVHDNFANLAQHLKRLQIDKVDGLLLDLGLSSMQLDGAGRGFSFQRDEPLDMRMDQEATETAADLVNDLDEEELADIFYHFGEERQSRRIAAAIIDERQRQRLETTGQLAGIVERAIPRRFHPQKIHVATKVFQGLRIAVNRELESLSIVLGQVAEVLKPGGRFCVISFHSLEDRLVKRAFSGNDRLRVLTRKPVTPGTDECRSNPRARSAKLRAAVLEGMQ